MHRVMGINDFSWTEKLVGKDGVLKVAVDEFRGTVQYYIDEYRRLLAEGLTQQAAAVEKKLWSYRRGKEDNRGRNELIEFLVRNNVLPKYGFPVDTVELYQTRMLPQIRSYKWSAICNWQSPSMHRTLRWWQMASFIQADTSESCLRPPDKIGKLHILLSATTLRA